MPAGCSGPVSVVDLPGIGPIPPLRNAYSGVLWGRASPPPRPRGRVDGDKWIGGCGPFVDDGIGLLRWVRNCHLWLQPTKQSVAADLQRRGDAGVVPPLRAEFRIAFLCFEIFHILFGSVYRGFYPTPGDQAARWGRNEKEEEWTGKNGKKSLSKKV